MIYFDCERKVTTSLNFSGGRFLNEGIGAVGFTSVRAMPCAYSFDPTWVRLGPGPSLPFSPILWQARQPDCATTFLPASNSDSNGPPAARMRLGVGVSIAVGEPAWAPW